MGKTRDLFKKIRDTKGTIHAKLSTIKERNVRDLTKAKAVNKKGQEYTEELYEKDLSDPNNHNGVVTHLQSDILKVKSSGPQEATLLTKLVEVTEFQLSYFKS